MNINDMIHRLRIYKRQVAKDSHGGKISQWNPGRYIFVGYRDAGAADTATRSDQITTSESRQLFARAGVRQLLSEGDRLQTSAGALLEIRGVSDHPDKRFIGLNCREVR